MLNTPNVYKMSIQHLIRCLISRTVSRSSVLNWVVKLSYSTVSLLQGSKFVFTRGQLWPSGIVGCVCLCLCVCVRQSSVCPDDNLSPPQGTITKIGPEVQNTLVKIPIVFGVHWHWLSRTNWTKKVKIYPISGLWVCPGDKSIQNEVRFSKFGPEMHRSTVKVPIDFGIDWSWSSVSFLTSNLLYSTKFCVS